MTTDMTHDNTSQIEEEGDVLDDQEILFSAGVFMDTFCETHPLYETARSLFFAACRNDQEGMKDALQVVEIAYEIDPDGCWRFGISWDPYEAPAPHAHPLQAPEKSILRINRVREVLSELICTRGDQTDLVALFFALVSRDEAATTAAYARIGEWTVAKNWCDDYDDEEMEERFGTSP